MEEYIDSLLAAGIICLSSSPAGAGFFLVEKRLEPSSHSAEATAVFANFYHCFIRNYSSVGRPVSHQPHKYHDTLRLDFSGQRCFLDPQAADHLGSHPSPARPFAAVHGGVRRIRFGVGAVLSQRASYNSITIPSKSFHSDPLCCIWVFPCTLTIYVSIPVEHDLSVKVYKIMHSDKG